jgi:hypothetical protein
VEGEQSEASDSDYDSLECGFAIGIGKARVGAVHAALKNCAVFFGIGLEQLSNKPSINIKRQTSNSTTPFGQEPQF